MDLYGKEGKSLPQKTLITVLEILIIVLSYWILFDNGYYKILFFANPSGGEGIFIRHLIIFIFNLIVFFRILLTTFYLIKRKIPWEEAFSIPAAFALYYIGFAMLGYKSTFAISYLDVIAILIFLFGSFINSYSEILRDKWKKQPENKGKLYTTGLFNYSMHINYFGDLLWVMGYAIITRNWYSILIVAFLFTFFAFYNIPKLDSYLKEKYGESFTQYSQNTKKLIPFIY